MDISKDFYQILEVSAEASDEEIKNSYRRLVKKYHPDSQNCNDQHMFNLIQSAWDILGDPEKRHTYDKKLKKQSWESIREEKLIKFQKNGTSSGEARPIVTNSWSYPKVKQEDKPGASRFIDRLKTIATSKSSESMTQITRRTLIQQPYPEQETTLKINPLELWFGVKKDLEIKSYCGPRKIRVKIPRGFILGTILNINCPMTEEFPEQSVKIFIELESHPNILIDGLDLTIFLPIRYSEAILGEEIIIPTPNEKIKFKIPKNFEVGKSLKLGSNGIKEGNKVGNLFIKPYLVELPESDTLLKVLAKLDQLYPTDIRSEITDKLNKLNDEN